MTKKERFAKFIMYFDRHMPEATTELKYKTPYELLVSVILSAQCTDKRVNLVTPDFFSRFPDAEKLAASTPEYVFTFIKSISYPNNKSKYLVGMARMLMEKFNGEIPSDVTLLQTLPGVGRKTANVIAACIYKQPKLAVDTHVFRVAARIGLSTNARTPLATEKQLIRYLPEDKIPLAHHWLIFHGRYICTARKPQCTKCGINNICKYFANINPM